MGNVLAVPQHHEQLIAAGALPALVDSLSQDDAETRFDAVFALAKCATRAETHETAAYTSWGELSN